MIKLELEGRAVWGVLFGLPFVTALCVALGAVLCLGTMIRLGTRSPRQDDGTQNVTQPDVRAQAIPLEITPTVAPVVAPVTLAVQVAEVPPVPLGLLPVIQEPTGATDFTLVPRVEPVLLPVEPIVGDSTMRLMVEATVKESGTPKAAGLQGRPKRDMLPAPREP